MFVIGEGVRVMARIIIRIPDELHALLKARAGQVGMPVSQLIMSYIMLCVDDDNLHRMITHVKNSWDRKE